MVVFWDKVEDGLDSRDCSGGDGGQGGHRSPGYPQRLESGGATRRERWKESLTMSQRSACTYGSGGLARLPPAVSAPQPPYTQSPGQAAACF